MENQQTISIFGQNRLHFSHFLIVFFIAWAAFSIKFLTKETRIPFDDELIYIQIAQELHTTGIFTDGFLAGEYVAKAEGTDTGPQELKPGKFMSPAYPYFLTMIAKFDGGFSQFLTCAVSDNAEILDLRRQLTGCDSYFPSIFILQSLLAAIGVACIFAIAMLLSNSLIVSIITTLLAVASGEVTRYIDSYFTENIAFAAFYLFLLGIVGAAVKRNIWFFLLAGIALGTAILSRPSYLYLFYTLIPLLVFLAILKPKKLYIPWASLAVFCGAAILVMTPWLIRNYTTFGEVFITSGYGGFILVQRLAFNMMTWSEWGIAFIYWLPDFGDNLARDLFDRESYERLIFSEKSSFFYHGNNDYRWQTIEAAGGHENYFSYLITQILLPNLASHIVVTLPMAVKGMGVGNYLSIAFVILFLPVCYLFYKAGKLTYLLILAFPLLFMVGFHAFVSVSVERYNMPIIALYSFICACFIVNLLGKSNRLRQLLRI